MTETELKVDVAFEGASDPSVPNNSKDRFRSNLILQVLAMVGIGAMLWPSGANWVSSLFHDGEISGYTSAVEKMKENERLAELEAAHEYNRHLPAGILQDPLDMCEEHEEVAVEAYRQVLTVNGTEAMGSLSYPALGIGLPIYHGTGEGALRKGVGHVYGSSLPVGGPGTHTALTAHSGQMHASLFDNLLKAKEGQTFQITVLGETTHYMVDQIKTVEPKAVGHLQIIPGDDYATLITCTPIGVNSHRELVRGVRIPAPETSGGGIIDGDCKTPGFPWWLVGFIGGSSVVAYLLFKSPKKNPKKLGTDPNVPEEVGSGGAS